MEIVEEFKYLGVIFHFTGSYIFALNYRISQAKRAFAIWWRKCLSWHFQPYMKLLLFKIYVVPVLEYGQKYFSLYSLPSGLADDQSQLHYGIVVRNLRYA